jgi:hypothetical protein
MDYISVSITGSEEQRPEFRDIVNFLWDFNLLYETSRLIVDPRYERFRFTQYVYTRHGRPLRKFDRLRLVELHYESPLKLKTIVGATVGAAGALWALVQTAQTVDHWTLEKKKLVAEVRKTELEARKAELEVEQLEDAKKARLALAEPKTHPPQQRPREEIMIVPRFADRHEVDGKPVRELQEFAKQIVARGAVDEMDSIIGRFERSPIRIEEVEIRIESGSRDAQTRK